MTLDTKTILQVSPSDIGGGAEKVAADLHRAYQTRGYDSWLAVGTLHGESPRTVRIPNSESFSAWRRGLSAAADSMHAPLDSHGARWVADRALRFAAAPAHMIGVQRGFEDFDFPGTKRLLDLTPSRADVLHLHNLHGGYFDIREVPALTRTVPTIMTMHDVWPLTGHCAYPLECERWLHGCGGCPDLDLPLPIRRDASARNARVKRAAFGDGSLRVATPSRWLMDLVERSGLAAHLAETRVIPNGVDTEVFSPGDRHAARAALGLPLDATIVLFSARSVTSSPFKGFDTLTRALPLIAQGTEDAGLLLVALGDDAPRTDTVAGGDGPPIRIVPFAEDPAVVANHYRAADLYLHPARAESFGLAVLEAMACGTPVVASDAGGLPEVVRHGETGLIVPRDDPAALAAAVTSLLADAETRDRMSAAGVARALELFTLDAQVDAYLEWYGELLGG